MFKIVQTEKKKKKELSIIPSNWEQNGVLFWPKNRASELIKNPKSVPNEDWLELSCKLKRDFLPDLETAEKEMKIMLKYVDTENEDDEYQSSQNSNKKARYKSKGKNSSVNIEVDYNSVAAQYSSMRPLKNVEILDTRPMVAINTGSEILSGSEEVEGDQTVFKPVDNVDGSIIELPLGNETITFLTSDSINKLQELEQRTKTIVENQQEIIQRLAKIETMFEMFIKQQNNVNKQMPIVRNFPDELCAEPFQPIESEEQLQELDEKLKCKITFNQYIDKFSFICGKNSHNRAIDNCYILVDKFFTRYFMTTCSWAGGCKKDNTVKTAFKTFKNVINLFYQIIFVADRSCSFHEIETFFKNVIKNSTRRNEVKPNSRQSRSKKRPRKPQTDDHELQVHVEQDNLEDEETSSNASSVIMQFKK